MKCLLFLFSFSFVAFSFGQKDVDLKRRYRGFYEGEIPGYSVRSNGELHFVADAPIEVVIGENQVQVKVGNNTMLGTYEVMFKADAYYLLDVDIEGQLAHERIMVYKRGKKLSRDGMFPQPISKLKKTNRRRR